MELEHDVFALASPELEAMCVTAIGHLLDSGLLVLVQISCAHDSSIRTNVLASIHFGCTKVCKTLQNLLHQSKILDSRLHPKSHNPNHCSPTSWSTTLALELNLLCCTLTENLRLELSTSTKIP